MTRRRVPSGTPVAERIRLSSTPSPDGCWLWDLRVNRYGYGVMAMAGGSKVGAHRAAYAAFVGPIPEGMTVDHLCFVTQCVNPEHLQLLTPSENSSRQRKVLRTHCPKGHPFDEENTASWAGNRGRVCRKCHRDCARRRKQEKGRRAA